MSAFNTRSEFTSLTDLVIKYSIFKIVVLVTIIVTLFNAIQSDGYRTIITDYQKINRIADTSWGVPYTGDWFVDHMFLNHGIYLPDSLDALREVVKHEEKNPIYKEANDIIYDIDTTKSYQSGPPDKGAKLPEIRIRLDSLIKRKSLANPQLAYTLLNAFVQDSHSTYRNDSICYEETKKHLANLSLSNRKLNQHQLEIAGNQYLDSIRYSLQIQPTTLPKEIGKDQLPGVALLEILRLPDTVRIDLARMHQEKLLNAMRAQVLSAFLLKLSFLTDVSLNIQYWIFILPFLLVLSFLYLYILRQKMIVVRHYAAMEVGEENTEGNYPAGLTSYDDHPYHYLIIIFASTITVLMLMFFYTYYVILTNIPGFKNDITICAMIASYFGLVYGATYRQQLLDEHVQSGINVNLIKWWKKFVGWLGKRYIRVSSNRRPLRGSILILITLYVAVCSRGCQRDPPANTDHYFIFFQNKWKVTDTLDFGSQGFVYTGYSLILNFKKNIWNWGTGGIWPNRVYQCGYTLLILIVVFYFITWVSKRFSKFERATVITQHVMCILTGAILLMFSVYYSVTFSYLTFSIYLTLILLSMWLFTKWHSIFGQHNQSFLDYSKGLLLFSMPFVVGAIISMIFLVIVMVFAMIQSMSGKDHLKDLFFTLFFIIFVNGKVFLYMGLLYFFRDQLCVQYMIFHPQPRTPRSKGHFLRLFRRSRNIS